MRCGKSMDISRLATGVVDADRREVDTPKEHHCQPSIRVRENRTHDSEGGAGKPVLIPDVPYC
uniref:Uncharacterized protein n=1 Tax=Candidatus Kentrum sp. TC TaxID=2126339 RepID=A0A451A8D3_9GAMM|nr:MAG: hypothetical protein BECKTC1821F_GA0114240_107212 [Candidatus Kentron sp. TC]